MRTRSTPGAATSPTTPRPTRAVMPGAIGRSTISRIPRARFSCNRAGSPATRSRRTTAASPRHGRAQSTSARSPIVRDWNRPACNDWYYDLELGGFLLLAQRPAQDLAHVGLGKLGAELDVFRPLVAGELLAAMLEHILLRELRILAHDVHLRHLAGMLVGNADDRAFEHARMHGDDLLDLVRVNIEARHKDHVLLAVDDADKAFLVHDADVAGAQKPVLTQDLRGVLGTLPIAFHHLLPADADLSGLPERHFGSGVVAKQDVSRGHRHADGAGVLG